MSLPSFLRSSRPRPFPRRRYAFHPRLWLEELEPRNLLSSGGTLDQRILVAETTSGDQQQTAAPAPVTVVDPAPTGGGTTVSTSPGPGGSSISPTAMQDSINSRWLTRLYQDMLLRTPNSSEVNYWVQVLDAGATRDQVAAAFVTSPEFRSQLLRADYRGYLGRDPEPGALNYWLAVMQAGGGQQAVAAQFLASDEFYQQHGGSGESWLAGLYGAVLGRAPDDAGMQVWESALQAGVSRDAIASVFLGSAEAYCRLVNESYAVLLHRDSLPSCEAFWVANLQQGMTPNDLLLAIIRAPEYSGDRLTMPGVSPMTLGLTGVNGVDGPVADGGLTANPALTLQGQASPGMAFVITVDGVTTSRVQAAQDGSWQASLPEGLGGGQHQVGVLALRGAGARASRTITVVTGTPSVTLQAPDFASTGDPTFTVNYDPHTNFNLGATVHFDVDLNGDGSFDGPDEQDFSTSTVRPGSTSVPLALGAGDFTVRARLVDTLGRTATSPAVTTQVDPTGGKIGSHYLLDLIKLAGGKVTKPAVETGGGSPAYGLQGDTSGDPLAAYKKLLVFDPQGRVEIHARAAVSGVLDQFAADLAKLGMVGIEKYPGQDLVNGFLPINQLVAVTKVPHFETALPVYRPRLNVGAVTTQGDAVMQTDVFRTQQGVDGTGVPVGVLSDSVSEFMNGLADSQATGDLPPNVTVLQDLGMPGTDEGRAMLEIVHDVAPGSPLQFHTGGISPQNMASGIVQLAQAGSKSIVDDISWFDSPFFNDGILSQAVDAVAAQGVSYSSAAGNSGSQGWRAPWSGISATVGGVTGTFADIGGGNPLQQFTLPAGASFQLDFQWDAAFLEGGSNQPNFIVPNNLDVLFVSSDGKTLLNRLNDINPTTGEAFETGGLQNPANATATQFAMAFLLVSGPAPTTIGWVNVGGADIQAQGQGNITIFGQPVARGAIAVGAVNYQTPTSPEPYSSLGGQIPILFDVAGNRLATPELRKKPEIVGPDNVDTTFFIPGQDTDGDGFPNFTGTSAAAPHVAAAIALLRQQAPFASVGLIEQYLRSHALHIATTPGFDPVSGSGLVQLTTRLEPFLTSNLLNDPFEPNETSDKAFNFGLLAAAQFYQNLTVNVHNGLPDYDWYQWQTGGGGTFTAAITNLPENGDLELHVFTVDANNTLKELGKADTSSDNTATVTAKVTKNELVLVEIKGVNDFPGFFGTGTYSLGVSLA